MSWYEASMSCRTTRGERDIFDELADATAADVAVKTLVDGFANRDGELTAHGIRYTYKVVAPFPGGARFPRTVPKVVCQSLRLPSLCRLLGDRSVNLNQGSEAGLF